MHQNYVASTCGSLVNLTYSPIYSSLVDTLHDMCQVNLVTVVGLQPIFVTISFYSADAAPLAIGYRFELVRVR
jgi:hypothetical protein